MSLSLSLSLLSLSLSASNFPRFLFDKFPVTLLPLYPSPLFLSIAGGRLVLQPVFYGAGCASSSRRQSLRHERQDEDDHTHGAFPYVLGHPPGAGQDTTLSVTSVVLSLQHVSVYPLIGP